MPKGKEIARALASGMGIVVSILLAFAIDAAWDARSERLVERATVDGIRKEFETNLQRLDELLVEHSGADTDLLGLLDTTIPDSEDDTEAEVDRLVRGLLVGDLFDPSTGTLEMLLNSGRMDLISDPDLRALLWTWKMQLTDVEDEAGMIESNVHEGRRILSRLGARGLNPDLRPSWREQLARLRSSPELSAQARTVLIDRGNYQSELETLKATTLLVLDAIR